MVIERAFVRQVSFPLLTPYRLSSGDLSLFDPIILELVDAEGRCGWGECLIVPGYTDETVAASWAAALEISQRLVGLTKDAANTIIGSYAARFPGICSTAYAALDMLDENSPFRISSDARVPLLAPCQAHDSTQIKDEVDQLIGEGFQTLKVKVGYRWQEDLDRLSIIQECIAGRATLRLDANRGFGCADGQDFARRLNPTGIELFEQPCAADDWNANAAVALVSTVGVMLDESIYALSDIERAAAIPNIRFIKLKLKKVGSASQLSHGLERITELGMTPVLGDGVSMEIGCWMESCIAAKQISNAGEMNGFLKVREGLFENPLTFKNGSVHLPAGYWPRLDRERLSVHTLRVEAFHKA